MAKAVATCKCSVCGKEFDVVSYKRNRAEADRFVEWAEGYITECRECERAEEHTRALEESEGMPELAGSEKQVKWAIDIRARLTREVEDGRFSSKHLAICWKSVVASKTDAHPSDAQDMSEYIRFADLGLPDDCTAEEAYAAMDTRINGYYRSALHHFAQRVNAQRSYCRSRKS